MPLRTRSADYRRGRVDNRQEVREFLTTRRARIRCPMLRINPAMLPKLV
jgi:hypothetical protein